MFWDQLSSASSTFRCWGLVKVPSNRVQRWTLSAGQLMDIVRWNLQRHIPVKMRGAEDDEEETTKSFTSRSTKRPGELAPLFGVQFSQERELDLAVTAAHWRPEGF